MKTEREFACRVTPTFAQPTDVLKLRAYDDPAFVVGLLEPDPNTFVGEVRCRGASHELQREPSFNNGPTYHLDDPHAAALHDLQLVRECQSELRSAVTTFSYREGTFTFSTVITCSDEALEVAEQLFQQHVLVFLNTLGPMTGYRGSE